MSDFANLRIRIESEEAELADSRLSRLVSTGASAERAANNLSRSFGKLAVPMIAVGSAAISISKLIDVGKTFESLNAQLITSTGSAENAADAFEAIKDFASTTPFDVEQVTESFNKLVNLGLTPSERALSSYGDTASSMGKSLNDLIEAVADASTGEFERLKDFGIKSSRQGDQVAFTFRGVTETVAFNAAAIEEHLTRLGENNFGGSMERQMATLGGAISNLGDQWDLMFNNINNQGVGVVIEDTIRGATAALEDFNASLESGQFATKLSAISGQFDGWGRDISSVLDILNSLFSNAAEYWFGQTSGFVSQFVENLRNLPITVRSFIQIIGAEFAAMVDIGGPNFKAFGAVVIAEIVALANKAEAYGKSIAQSLNPFSDGGFDLQSELQEINRIADSISDQAFSAGEQSIRIAAGAYRDSITAIIEEGQEAIRTKDIQLAAADELRKKFDETTAARRASTEDRLARFKVEVDEDANTASPSAITSFNKLVESLRTEEEAIQESYNRRLDIILANTKEGSEQQQSLIDRLNKNFATDALGDFAAPDTFDEQRAQIESSFQARRDLILNNTRITEEQRTALEEELTKQRNEKINAIEQQRSSLLLQTNSKLFGDLSGLAYAFAGEQSGIFQGLFAVSKAFAIADSIVKIQQGIASAISLGFPTGLVAAAEVASASAGIISTINGTNFAGAFDNGGRIPSGSIGLVGEFGPELIQGPANVTSRKETANAFRQAQNQNNAPQTPAQPIQQNFRIINTFDTQEIASAMGSTEGERVIMNHIKRNARTLKQLVA